MTHRELLGLADRVAALPTVEKLQLATGLLNKGEIRIAEGVIELALNDLHLAARGESPVPLTRKG